MESKRLIQLVELVIGIAVLLLVGYVPEFESIQSDLILVLGLLFAAVLMGEPLAKIIGIVFSLYVLVLPVLKTVVARTASTKDDEMLATIERIVSALSGAMVEQAKQPPREVVVPPFDAAIPGG